jgi:error-prone DNA polymerase
VMTSRFMVVQGRVQRAGLVIHIVAEKFLDLTDTLRQLRDDMPGAPSPIRPSLPDDMTLIKSRDFH